MKTLVFQNAERAGAQFAPIVEPIDELETYAGERICIWPWFDLSDDQKLNSLWKQYRISRLQSGIHPGWPSKVNIDYYPFGMVEYLADECAALGSYVTELRCEGTWNYYAPRDPVLDRCTLVADANGASIVRFVGKEWMLRFRSFGQARVALKNAIGKKLGDSRITTPLYHDDDLPNMYNCAPAPVNVTYAEMGDGRYIIVKDDMAYFLQVYVLDGYTNSKEYVDHCHRLYEDRYCVVYCGKEYVLEPSRYRCDRKAAIFREAVILKDGLPLTV